MSEKHSLREHLKRASQTVDAWPEWKQRALGGGATSGRRDNETGEAKQVARAPSDKGKAD